MILRHRDRELLRFEWVRDARVSILSVNDAEYVGVSVKTNGDLKAETKSWGKVKFDKGVKVDVSEDGTELVIPVPANAEKGFMIGQARLRRGNT